MNATTESRPGTWVAVFDLDGTLTWRDTLWPYLAGFLWRHPWRIVRVIGAPYAIYCYWRDRDRGDLKSRCIRMIMGGSSRAVVSAWSEHFVNAMETAGRFRPLALAVLEAHRAAGDHLVLMSASPDLYVRRIGELLRVEHTVCTAIRWQGETLDGRLASENCRGQEKSTQLLTLRQRYPGAAFIAYGNSSSDLDHMREAERALLVNGNMEARTLARQSGIEVSSWN